ncbi:MAG TPA: alkaline phosphatase [Candidatus Limnocylindria bacterium]|nr:alkaline phosphatase [Candidatus Limnocylindria bacterium]
MLSPLRNCLLPCLFRTFLIVLFLSPATAVAPAQNQAGPPIPKYVFFFLADGAGMAHLEIARQYRRQIHHQDFVIVDKIMKEGHLGVMTTHAANSLSTDSAAAATALAVGCKANIGALGICADGTPAVSAMEIARRRGMRLGLVTNATVYDASPAAFVCQVPNRRDFAAIVNRYLELEPHVLLGGGKDQFLPKSQPGSRRADETDLIAAFEKKGYRHLSSKSDIDGIAGGKTLGLFSLRDMSFELDRDKNNEPSIYDMTRAAIRLLHDRNPNGFFVFIESENIDSAGHLSDVASMIHDYGEFDRAVGLAYEFYRKYPRETLIIVTSDHETGGLGFTLALKDLTSTKGDNQAAGTGADFKKIETIGISLRKASALLGRKPTAEAIDQLMQDHFPGFVMAPEYKEAIVKRRPLSRTLFTDLTAQALGMMIANNTQVYWQTSAHTNQPVLVASLGVGAERFRGYYDNADFGMKLKALLEVKNRR